MECSLNLLASRFPYILVIADTTAKNKHACKHTSCFNSFPANLCCFLHVRRKHACVHVYTCSNACKYVVYEYTNLCFSIVFCNISGCELCTEENLCVQCSGDLELNAHGNECAVPLAALSPAATGLSAGVIVGMLSVCGIHASSLCQCLRE